MQYNDHFLYHAENGHIPVYDLVYQCIISCIKALVYFGPLIFSDPDNELCKKLCCHEFIPKHHRVSFLWL